MSQDRFPQNKLTPPIAAKKPQSLILHNDERVDNYYWLREKENPEVITYLEAENSYTQAMMQHTEVLQEKLYKEILARIQETDLSVPYRKDEY
ncbi:MAG: oligopeptidase B, partial [Chroococcidiopsis sp.]